MTNHPNRSQTIEARRARLNILISRPAGFLGADGNRAFGPGVFVRYSYSDVPDDLLPAPDTECGRHFDAEQEAWDPEAISSAGTRGAFRNVYPVKAMRQYVADLHAAWGSLHVQDNSGLLPDLHQGNWK